MQASDIVDRVRSVFGDKDAAQVTDDDFLRWINDAQREIASKFEFSQVKGVHDLIAGESEYTLPDGVFKIYSVILNGTPLSYVKPQVGMGFGAGSGTPTHYWSWNGALNLHPTPDTGKMNGLVIYYLSAPNQVISLESELAVPGEYHSRIADYCLSQAYLVDNSIDNYQMMQSKLNNDFSWLFNDKTSDRTDYYPVIGAGEEYD